MRSRKIPAAAAAIAIMFVLIIGIERQRNCRYAGGTHCLLFGIGLGKYGGPQ